MRFPKRKRIEDPELKTAAAIAPCLCCSRAPSDPAQGGDEVDYRLVPLCPAHRSEARIRGWGHMTARYPAVELTLRTLGWTWESGRLYHPALCASF